MQQQLDQNCGSDQSFAVSSFGHYMGLIKVDPKYTQKQTKQQQRHYLPKYKAFEKKMNKRRGNTDGRKNK